MEAGFSQIQSHIYIPLNQRKQCSFSSVYIDHVCLAQQYLVMYLLVFTPLIWQIKMVLDFDNFYGMHQIVGQYRYRVGGNGKG